MMNDDRSATSKDVQPAIAIDDDVNIDNDVNVDNDVAAADANTSVCDNKKVV